MPRRRKSSLGRNTCASKRMRLVRENESKEKRKARLNHCANYNRTQRATQSQLQRSKTLALDRIRHRLRRNNETSTRKKSRLFLDRKRHALKREAESLQKGTCRIGVDTVTVTGTDASTRDRRSVVTSADDKIPQPPQHTMPSRSCQSQRNPTQRPS